MNRELTRLLLLVLGLFREMISDCSLGIVLRKIKETDSQSVFFFFHHRTLIKGAIHN